MGEICAQIPRNYLKGSALQKDLTSLRAKCIAVQKRVSPSDTDLGQTKISFQRELNKVNFNDHSGFTVINQTQSFATSNDITNSDYNPVIHKITNFMQKKDRRISGKIGVSE